MDAVRRRQRPVKHRQRKLVGINRLVLFPLANEQKRQPTEQPPGERLAEPELPPFADKQRRTKNMERWDGKPLQRFFHLSFDALIEKRRTRVGTDRRDGQKAFHAAFFRQRRGAQRIFIINLNESLLRFRFFARRPEAAKDIVDSKIPLVRLKLGKIGDDLLQLFMLDRQRRANEHCHLPVYIRLQQQLQHFTADQTARSEQKGCSSLQLPNLQGYKRSSFIIYEPERKNYLFFDDFSGCRRFLDTSRD